MSLYALLTHYVPVQMEKKTFLSGTALLLTSGTAVLSQSKTALKTFLFTYLYLWPTLSYSDLLTGIGYYI